MSATHQITSQEARLLRAYHNLSKSDGELTPTVIKEGIVEVCFLLLIEQPEGIQKASSHICQLKRLYEFLSAI